MPETKSERPEVTASRVEKKRPLKTIYISYFGALKHLCQTQVIPYLKELSREGIEVTLLSFEERLSSPEEERRQRAKLKSTLAESKIDWHYLRYHKKPSLPATVYDVLVGIVYASYVLMRKEIDVVHARNHVPAVMALVLRALFRVKVLFDMRGVMAEEYLDAGIWKKNSLPFRITKWVEGKSLRKADAIVMLTRKIKDVLEAESPDLRANPVPIEIIPSCVDLAKYPPTDGTLLRHQLGLQDKTVMVYSGSLGGWYLTEEMVRLFAAGRSWRDRFHFLVLTQSRYELITEILQKYGIPQDAYTITTIPQEDMPAYLAAGDFAISFIKPCYSKLSSSPTKIGEYLASGLPIITNTGIGDVDDLMKGKGIGVLVDSFNSSSYDQALVEMLSLLANREEMRRRCRQAAESYLSLSNVGKEGYLRVYQRLGWER